MSFATWLYVSNNSQIFKMQFCKQSVFIVTLLSCSVAWTFAYPLFFWKLLVVQLCLILCRTIVFQAPLSMGFSGQEYWNGLTFPSPGDFPDPGIKPGSSACKWIIYHLSHQQVLLLWGWPSEKGRTAALDFQAQSNTCLSLRISWSLSLSVSWALLSIWTPSSPHSQNFWDSAADPLPLTLWSAKATFSPNIPLLCLP